MYIDDKCITHNLIIGNSNFCLVTCSKNTIVPEHVVLASSFTAFPLMEPRHAVAM